MGVFAKFDRYLIVLDTCKTESGKMFCGSLMLYEYHELGYQYPNPNLPSVYLID